MKLESLENKKAEGIGNVYIENYISIPGGPKSQNLVGNSKNGHRVGQTGPPNLYGAGAR
jgi:hypothetical protein